ncbi:MAG TPA: NrfD/PsrC family molybdoenzyme membrane anchor subunit [Actinomycetota bacterium]|nr:NrfD/PsrC family molybdoenzyme membrane anchor subunit [Actinomycetota bacterium]
MIPSGPGPGDPASSASRTYYDRPLLNEPVWIWAVPAYLYVGGVAGAAMVLAGAAEAAGQDVNGLVRACRRTGAVGAGIGTVLLVYDLGRPERFLNMLRVFRPTSPMSVGSWTLAAAAPVFGASALVPPKLGGRIAGKAGAVLGLPLVAYTAPLLSTTAVPLWQQVRRTLPFVFVSSAAQSAAALLQLTSLSAVESKIVGRLATLAQAGELAAAFALEREAHSSERVARGLDEGVGGALWRISKISTGAALALGLLPVRARSKRIARGLLGTLAGVTLRFGIFYGGKASARDPRASFEPQRARREDGRMEPRGDDR